MPALADRPYTFSFDAIARAADRIRAHAVRTPLIESAELNERIGARVLLKAESLQKTGSFKFRGACNRLLQLDPERRSAGVVAASSGNHALAVSAICAELGVPAVIVMPSDAPRTKIEGARRHGATVRLYDRRADDRDAITNDIAASRGAVVIPAYDDADVMAGQGTVGLEIVEQLAERGLPAPEMVLAPCSGGGLVAGVATAVRHAHAGAEIYAVEPAGFDDLARSLAAGHRVANQPGGTSLCDSLQVGQPGKLTFDVNRNLLRGSLVVTDADVREAMAFACTHLRLVLEPGGAAALAALLARKVQARGQAIVAVLSGGNVDADAYCDALREARSLN